MELKNFDKSADGFGSLELEVTFEKTAKIIKGKKEETRKIPLTIQERTGGTVICNPDPAFRFIGSSAKRAMCDSIKGTFNAATQKCTPPFLGQSCPHYIAGFDGDGKAICDRYPANITPAGINPAYSHTYTSVTTNSSTANATCSPTTSGAGKLLLRDF